MPKCQRTGCDNDAHRVLMFRVWMTSKKIGPPCELVMPRLWACEDCIAKLKLKDMDSHDLRRSLSRQFKKKYGRVPSFDTLEMHFVTRGNLI